jgi:serine/threonine protein kinase
LPGARLGPYTITASIGAGGMGEVYRATDTRLERNVAIKILPAHVASDPELKQRFEREAKTLAALHHPHICSVFDVGTQDGVDFLVMEYVEGETLADRLARVAGSKDSALRIEDVLRYAIQIADALDKAHRKGIVHRDLKPGNVMLTKSGAKLLDFGLAKRQAASAVVGMSLAATVSQPLTGQGTILGTLHYMPPEQLEGKEADPRSDIFSFGALVYEMATGKKAFEGKSAASVIAAVLEREPAAMSSLQPLTPVLLEHVVSRCLAKDPDERWQTSADLMRELKWIADTRSQAGSPTPVTTPGKRRERIAWTTAAVAAVIAASAITLAITRLDNAIVPEVRVDIATPPSSFPDHFALSPDGRWLAFVATPGASELPQLFLRSLQDGSMEPLKGTTSALSPFWSPDSRSIGFAASNELKRFDLSDRTVRNLSAPIGPGVGVTASWNRDNVILFARTVVAPLRRVSASAKSEPTAQTMLKNGESGHGIPRFLPDGKHYLYQVWGTPDVKGVYIGSIDGSEPRRLLDADGGAVAGFDHVLFVRQGALLAQPFDMSRLEPIGEPFRVADGVGEVTRTQSVNVAAISVSDAGTIAFRARGAATRPQLVWFDRSGAEVGRIADSGDFLSPAISLNGRRLAVARFVDGNEDIWVFDIERGAWTRVTSDEARDSQPVLSPEGQRVAFFSPRAGGRNLYVRQADGTGTDELILATQGANSLIGWSPDSKFLLVAGSVGRDGAPGLWLVPVDRSGAPTPAVSDRSDNPFGNAELSPDGKWIASEVRDSGRPEIYVQPFQRSGPRVPITATGGAQVRWRGDGKELFYIGLDGRLMAVPVRAAVDGSAFEVGKGVPLFLTRTPGGVVQQGGRRQQYVVSPDGSRFLVGMDSADSAALPPITLILNWNAGLARRP